MAWTAGVRLEPWLSVLVLSSTWAVYVGDRLLDVRRAIRSGNLTSLRERHYFHWHHRRLFLPLAVLSALVAALLILRWMPAPLRERDSLVAVAAIVYFSGVHSSATLPVWLQRLISKESLVGALFTAGCAMPALSRLRSSEQSVPVAFGIAVVFFALLAWLNCAAIEAWESHAAPREHVAQMALALSVLGMVCAFGLARSHAAVSALVCAGSISAILLSQLHRWRRLLAPVTTRALADLVLLTPILLLAVGAHGR